MNNIILLVFEGEKTEVQVFHSLNNNFFCDSKNSVIHATFNGEIYQLWKQIDADPDLDLIEVLRERNDKNKKELDGILRKNVSQIYLFFDHDAHGCTELKVSNEAILKMLKCFDNETDNGKLFLSYPMVEALKDCKADPNICFINCIYSIDENTSYKNVVANSSDFLHIKKISRNDWFYIIVKNFQKAFCIVNNYYKLPSYEEALLLTQEQVYTNQFKKFISMTKCVAILSSFPFFIVDYFGEKLYQEIILNEFIQHCEFKHLIK